MGFKKKEKETSSKPCYRWKTLNIPIISIVEGKKLIDGALPCIESFDLVVWSNCFDLIYIIIIINSMIIFKILKSMLLFDTFCFKKDVKFQI